MSDALQWPLEENFKGNHRFIIRQRLGAGGMGVVYEAYDTLTSQIVALKTLKRADPSAIYRLKNEFRALADIAHPNLVSLFELFIDGNDCFFTMEFVEGVNFVAYSMNEGHSAVSRTSQEEPTASIAASGPFPSEQDSHATIWPFSGKHGADAGSFQANSDMLYSALRQLADGLGALHEGGKLHRDIKPSNILVTRPGRVVILDFGLATQVLPDESRITRGFFGTPSYISPEQALGKALSPASDWYSVGVTLYEALTGRLPFEGSYLEVLNRKQSTDPAPPSQFVRGIPGDLEELCMALLSRDPAARPSGHEILHRLGTKGSAARDVSVDSESVSFVGRREHLSKLHRAFEDAKQGATVKAYIHGGSGVGKSTLVRKFLRELETNEQVLVLTGRCYERESIPYKAFDGVADSLTRHLVSLPADRAQALLPRDMAAITKMFPVLGRVEAGYRTLVNDTPDPLALRRRAFNSLQEILGRISDRVPIVISIDDMHWSDSDSITLIEHLLRPPDAPRLLFLATFRGENDQTVPHLKPLLNEIGNKNCFEIALDALSTREAVRLTRSLLGKSPATQEFTDMVVREARGNPFLIEQLVRWAAGADEAGSQSISVSDLLDANMRRLPDGARVILETLSLAAHPIPPAVAFRACGLTAENAQPLVASLSSASFLRGGGARYPLELYHDRIREYVRSLLSPERKRAIHHSLAESLVASGLHDPEVLFEHYLGANEVELAARNAMLAATKASEVFAFDQAAAFWRWALELVPHPPNETARIKSDLGEALANAGRPAEAAAVYLEAAQASGPADALELERRAANQLLLGGHVDKGLEVIRRVLDRVGLRLAPGYKTALLSLRLRRFELRLRGLHFTERRVDEIPASKLLHIDICWTVAAGLAMVDNIRGADFQTRHLLLALGAGEPYRIARAMAVEAGFSATSGSSGRRRAERFSRMAEDLSSRVENPHAIGMTKLTAGVSKFLVGEWTQALDLCETAYQILRDRCTGVLWELTSAQNFILGSLLYIGELQQIERRLPAIMATADERGNLYAVTEIKTRMNFMWLVAGDPEGARRELTEALTLWSHAGFHRQHYNALLAEAQIELYTGNPKKALLIVNSRWPELRRTMLLRIQVLRIEALCLKARSALAIAEREPEQRAHLTAEAEALARRIEREQMPWSNPLAYLLQGGAAGLRGDRSVSQRLLSKAVESFESAGMALHAAVARLRLGQIDHSDTGTALAESAGRWMADQRIKDPEGILRTLAPGFSKRGA